MAHQIPSRDIAATMRANNAKVQACFEAGGKRDPSINGEVKLRFVIDNDGHVRVWRDDGSSMEDEEVPKCVGAVIERLKFPKQKSPGDAWGIFLGLVLALRAPPRWVRRWPCSAPSITMAGARGHAPSR